MLLQYYTVPVLMYHTFFIVLPLPPLKSSIMTEAYALPKILLFSMFSCYENKILPWRKKNLRKAGNKQEGILWFFEWCIWGGVVCDSLLIVLLCVQAGVELAV